MRLKLETLNNGCQFIFLRSITRLLKILSSNSVTFRLIDYICYYYKLHTKYQTTKEDKSQFFQISSNGFDLILLHVSSKFQTKRIGERLQAKSKFSSQIIILLSLFYLRFDTLVRLFAEKCNFTLKKDRNCLGNFWYIRIFKPHSRVCFLTGIFRSNNFG